MAVPRALAWLVRLRPAQAWMLVLLCLDLAAIGDLVSGSDLWFGPVYLCVICLASWALGWRSGQGIGIAIMALTFAINGFSLYPHGAEAFAANLMTRFVALSLIVAVIAAMRRAYLREWHLARTDPLTGALNRQAFFELAENGGRHWRLLVYADLDGFKRINDRDGHAAGDICLKTFVTAVSKSIRSSDLLARVGGDEFLLLMTVRDEPAARIVAARLHERMNAIAVHDGTLLRCSVGALGIAPGLTSIDELVRIGDDLMYRAKTAGGGLEFASTRGTGAAIPPGRARAPSRAPAMIGSPGRRRRAERREPLPA